MAEFIKGIFSKPGYVLLFLGLALLVLAAAGTVTVQEQTIAVADPPWRIGIAVVGFLLAALGVGLIYTDLRNPRPGRPLKLQYDVFLASAMAAVDDEEAYKKQRGEIARIKEALLTRPGIVRIYDSGSNLAFGKWEPGQVAAEVDLEALRHSRYLMLYYPEKLASSVLFEAGYAVGMGKPAVYIVRERKDLPFLMREMESVSRTYPQVRIWECGSVDDVIDRIQRSGTHVFAGDKASPGEEAAAASDQAG